MALSKTGAIFINFQWMLKNLSHHEKEFGNSPQSCWDNVAFPPGNYKQKVMNVTVCHVVSKEWFDLYGIKAETRYMIFHVFGTTH